MNKKYFTLFITVVAVVAMVGIGSYALAGSGKGYGGRGDCDNYGQRGSGHHGDGYHGYHGYGHRRYGGEGENDSGRDYGDDLTQVEFEKLEAEREAFLKDTKELRENLHDKKIALRRELAGENPDAQKAGEVQKDISGLRAELDQKKIDHLIKMRKIAPQAGKGQAGKGRRGGYGSRGGGHCWE